ncbi:MAG: hypothetical protein AMXMBFR36_13300 [Acidobacteriota bacterium]
MIRAHRDRHRRLWIALALLLPALLAAALLSRPDAPELDRAIDGIAPLAEAAP